MANEAVTGVCGPSFAMPSVSVTGKPVICLGPDGVTRDGLKTVAGGRVNVGATGAGAPQLQLGAAWTLDFWLRAPLPRTEGKHNYLLRTRSTTDTVVLGVPSDETDLPPQLGSCDQYYMEGGKHKWYLSGVDVTELSNGWHRVHVSLLLG